MTCVGDSPPVLSRRHCSDTSMLAWSKNAHMWVWWCSSTLWSLSVSAQVKCEVMAPQTFQEYSAARHSFDWWWAISLVQEQPATLVLDGWDTAACHCSWTSHDVPSHNSPMDSMCVKEIPFRLWSDIFPLPHNAHCEWALSLTCQSFSIRHMYERSVTGTPTYPDVSAWWVFVGTEDLTDSI